MRHIVSFSGGKDSTALGLLMLEKGMTVDDFIFFDTGWEFPQMYAHIVEFERYTGRKVTTLHPKRPFEDWMITHPVVARKGPLKGRVHRIGNGWPSPSRRWCTREKVATIDRYVASTWGGDAHRYIGFAADEPERPLKVTAQAKTYPVSYPLIEWGMTEDDCLAMCKAAGFTWGGLYDHFRRVSCYCCPLQPLAELRTLRTHYPELWQNMLRWEDEMEDRNRGFRKYVTVHQLEDRFAKEFKGPS